MAPQGPPSAPQARFMASQIPLETPNVPSRTPGDPRPPQAPPGAPTSPFMACMASLACSGLVKVTKPKPRDRWVSLSFTTTTEGGGVGRGTAGSGGAGTTPKPPLRKGKEARDHPPKTGPWQRDRGAEMNPINQRCHSGIWGPPGVLGVLQEDLRGGNAPKNEFRAFQKFLGEDYGERLGCLRHGGVLSVPGRFLGWPRAGFGWPKWFRDALGGILGCPRAVLGVSGGIGVSQGGFWGPGEGFEVSRESWGSFWGPGEGFWMSWSCFGCFKGYWSVQGEFWGFLGRF